MYSFLPEDARRSLQSQQTSHCTEKKAQDGTSKEEW